MSASSDHIAEVVAETGVNIDAALVLIAALIAKNSTTADDSAQLNTAAEMLKAESDKLAAAVAANSVA